MFGGTAAVGKEDMTMDILTSSGEASMMSVNKTHSTLVEFCKFSSMSSATEFMYLPIRLLEPLSVAKGKLAP